MKFGARMRWAVGVAAALLTTAGVLIANAGPGSAAGASTVCAPSPSPSGTGYWTPFGDAQWGGTGLQTSSKPDTSQPYGVTCGGASVYGSALPASNPSQINALSFDFLASATGPSGNSPRLVVCFSDGSNCDSNGNLAPTAWTAGVWTHVDGFAPAAHGDVWSNSGGRCGAIVPNSYSAIVACHPGATVTQVAVVNDSGANYPAGEEILLNNMTVNGVVAHEVAPVLGQRAEIAPLSGSVSVRQPGGHRFIRVKTIMALRYGAKIHASGGHLQVIAATPGHGFESGQFYSGAFNLTQGKSGYVQAALTGHPTGCGNTDGAHAAATRPLRLWGRVKGRYRTRGRYGSASVRGTVWLTENRCDGTYFRVVEGTLRIRDFVRHKTIILHAGHSYLARRPAPKVFDPDHDGDNDAGLFGSK